MSGKVLILCVVLALQGPAGSWSQEPPDRRETARCDPEAYLAQAPPGDTPLVFAPGIVSLEGRCETYPTFSPDGKEMFFSVVDASWTTGGLFHTKLRDGIWTPPERASFSSRECINWESFIAPDGRSMVLTSSRPPSSASNMDLWVVERASDTTWSQPVRLDPPVNSDTDDGSACVTSDGTIYFHSRRGGGVGGSELYRSAPVGKGSATVENLGSIIETGPQEGEPYVAPDGSYLIFISQTRTAGRGGWDLWICFHRKDGSWTRPSNMGPPINTADDEYGPRVTHDGKYLFFTRETRGKTMKIHWVSTSVVHQLGEHSGGVPSPVGGRAPQP